MMKSKTGQIVVQQSWNSQLLKRCQKKRFQVNQHLSLSSTAGFPPYSVLKMDIEQIDSFNMLIKNEQIDLQPIQLPAYQEKRSRYTFMDENMGIKHLTKSFNSSLLDFFAQKQMELSKTSGCTQTSKGWGRRERKKSMFYCLSSFIQKTVRRHVYLRPYCVRRVRLQVTYRRVQYLISQIINQ